MPPLCRAPPKRMDIKRLTHIVALAENARIPVDNPATDESGYIAADYIEPKT